MARIEIKRTKQYSDRLRLYEVELDGNIIGKLKAGEIFTYELPEGKHSLRLRIDWASSNIVNFEISADQTLYFESGSNVPMFLELIYITFLRHKYLWLKQVENNTAFD
jgi:hypothetical protein